MLGAGPIGDMAARIAVQLDCRALVADPVPERLGRVATYGAETVPMINPHDGVLEMVRAITHGRGADAVIDAAGMEAHGSPITEIVSNVHLPLVEAPTAYRDFRDKRDGMVKVVFQP